MNKAYLGCGQRPRWSNPAFVHHGNVFFFYPESLFLVYFPEFKAAAVGWSGSRPIWFETRKAATV